MILLLLLIFGSMRPLLLGVLTLSLAVLAGFTVVHFVFGEVHLLALVFGCQPPDRPVVSITPV